MFGLISKKRVGRVLLESYEKEPDCGGDYAQHKCGGNHYDRHNAINWIASKLEIELQYVGGKWHGRKEKHATGK
jgi:hypothetical protein